MNSPWLLIYVIATNGDQNKEPHILSHCRNQMGHYYLIKSAALKVLIFILTNLAHVANYLFTKDRRVRLMNQLSDFGPSVDISASYANDNVAHLIVVPKICLKPPNEEYAKTGMAESELHFSSFPTVNTYSALDNSQPFAV